MQRRIAFQRIAAAALGRADRVVRQWLPNGHRQADEWISRNPTRADRRAGSFKINVKTGQWSDFATGDKGGDLISLAAYIFRLPQGEAAHRLAAMLGVEPYEG